MLRLTRSPINLFDPFLRGCLWFIIGSILIIINGRDGYLTVNEPLNKECVPRPPVVGVARRDLRQVVL